MTSKIKTISKIKKTTNIKTTSKKKTTSKMKAASKLKTTSKMASPSKLFWPSLPLKSYLQFFWWLLTLKATRQLMSNRICYQVSKPKMEFHMIDIIYIGEGQGIKGWLIISLCNLLLFLLTYLKTWTNRYWWPLWWWYWWWWCSKWGG